MLFLVFSRAYHSSGIHLKGPSAHPLSLLIIVQFCIFSFPGVIGISFFGVDSLRYYGISNEMKIEIGLWYIYSVVIFICTNITFLRCFNIHSYQANVGKVIEFKFVKKQIFIILFFAIFSLLAKLAFSKTPPLLYLLSGNAEMAYNARIDIQTNPQDYYLPYISNIVSLLSVYQFYFIFYLYVFTNSKPRGSIILLSLSFLLALIECLYETQKAPLVFLLLGIVFIYYLKKQTITKLFVMFVVLAFCVVMLQAFVIDSDMTLAFESSIDRFIFGQNQGFYHIINSIKPDEKYWFSSFYFIERLGISPSRADVDVIPYLDVYKNVDIVNVNSYYLGEAWSMFGYYGLLFSPFIVGFCTALFIKIIDLLIGFNPIYFIPYSIYIIPEFRINQAFNYFLYGKEFVFKTLMVILIVAIVSFFLKIKLNLKGTSIQNAK